MRETRINLPSGEVIAIKLPDDDAVERLAFILATDIAGPGNKIEPLLESTREIARRHLVLRMNEGDENGR